MFIHHADAVLHLYTYMHLYSVCEIDDLVFMTAYIHQIYKFQKVNPPESIIYREMHRLSCHINYICNFGGVMKKHLYMHTLKLIHIYALHKLTLCEIGVWACNKF